MSRRPPQPDEASPDAAPLADDRRLLEELLESRESLADAQRIAHLGSWDWNIAEGSLAWSDEIYRIFGLEPQQFGATYEAFLEYVHPDDREKVELAVAKALKDETRYGVTHRVVRPDGEERVVYERGEVRFDEFERPVRMLGTVQDITEQKRLEHELDRSQAYNRGLIEASADGLITVDADGLITDVNEQMCRMTGRSRKELIGSAFASYFADPERAEVGVRTTFDNVVVNDYALTLVTADGDELVVSFNAALYRDQSGEVAGIFASARDITEQKRLESEMRDAQLYTRSLIEASLDALMTTDENGLISDVNAAMEALTGSSREELIGTRLRHYATDPDRAAAGIEQVLRDGTVRDYELAIRARDGHETDVSFNATTFLDQSGRPRGIFADARDLTDRKRFEEEKYLTRFFDLALDLLCVVNLDGRFERVSPAFEQQLGWAPEEMCGHSILDFVHPDDRDEASAQMKEHRLRRPAINFENRCLRKDGSYRWLLWRMSPSESGLLYATARDITEWKQHAEELRTLAEEREEALHRTMALQGVSAALTAAVTPEQVMQVVFDSAFSALGAESGALGLASDDRKTIESERAGLAPEIVERYASAPIEENLPQNLCVRDGVEIWCSSLDDLRTEFPQPAEILAKSGYNAFICLPLSAEGETIGYLAARFHDERAFPENDRAFARTVAEQCSQAIARARLYQQRERALASTRVLQRVSAGLTRATTLEEVGRVIDEEAFPLLGVAAGSVGILDDKRECIRLSMGGWDSRVADSYQEIPLAADLPGSVCVRERRACWYRTRAELEGDFPELPTAIAEASFEGAFFLPLETSGEAIGFFSGFFARPRSFKQPERELIETVAEQCAQALARALLYEERTERAEAALVLERVGDGIFRLDGEKRIKTWNPAAARMTGIPASQALGKPIGEILEGWDDPSRRLELAPPGEPASRRSLPFVLGGRELWLSISGVRLLSGAVYAFHDVTAEHELERRQHDFIATVSHELRTPLASVYGALCTLQRERLDPETQALLLNVATEQGERLRRLVDEILIASEVDTTELRMNDLSIDPLEIARNVVDANEPRLPTGITLELSAPESLPRLHADPDRLQQVLGNVIDNAVKFSPFGGVISVGISASPDEVVFEISDQGIGIPVVERERIFERFYRLDPAQTRGIGGTGLGLFICRELVERMGGVIGVDSAAGGGSVFRIALPLERRHGADLGRDPSEN